MKESSLHAALKNFYTQEGDQQEVTLNGYGIDVVSDGRLIEIQTGQFHLIRPKLEALLKEYPILLVYPIAQIKWITRLPADGTSLTKPRKSPKQGRPEQLFSELVHIPRLVNHPNFSLEVIMIHEEDTWRNDGKGSWRRKGWSVADRKLIKMGDRISFTQPADFITYLPADIPTPYTSQELALAARLSLRLAQQMNYCLAAMGEIEAVGHKNRAKLYMPRRTG